MMLKRFVTDPLMLFLLVGGILFAIDHWSGRNAVEDDVGGDLDAGEVDRILITESVFSQLKEGFSTRWRRPPTPDELKGLLDAHIRDEVLFREALKLGLDRDDAIIRRRLAQKMEFLTSDLADLPEPTDEELTAYFQENAERYRRTPLLSFKQIYFNSDRRGVDARPAAEELLRKLKEGTIAGEDAMAEGDRSMLHVEFEDTGLTEISRRFGRQFAEGIDSLKVGSWGGPVDSAFGTHIIFVSSKQDAVLPRFEIERRRVATDFMSERRREQNQSFLDELLSKYDVVVERTENENPNKIRGDATGAAPTNLGQEDDGA